VLPHMLKELFGGETKVENVKIVPDRNVSRLHPRDLKNLTPLVLVESWWFSVRLRYNDFP
jgi:hypothetical protein